MEIVLSNTILLTNVSIVPGENDNLFFVLGKNKLQPRRRGDFHMVLIKNSVINYFIL